MSSRLAYRLLVACVASSISTPRSAVAAAAGAGSEPNRATDSDTSQAVGPVSGGASAQSAGPADAGTPASQPAAGVVTAPGLVVTDMARDLPPPAAAGAVTGSPALSAPPQAAPGLQPPQAPPGTFGYGLPGFIGEIGSLAFLMDERTLAMAPVGYLLWPPFVHLVHDRPGAALGSLALRVGLPLATAFTAGLLSGCTPSSENELACAPAPVLGGLVAAIVAMGIDAKLSRAPVGSPASLRLGIMGGVLAGQGRKPMAAATLALETDSPSSPMTYSLQVTGAFGDQASPGLLQWPAGKTGAVQSGAARLLIGWRVVEGRRSFLAIGPVAGLRSTLALNDYDEFGADLGAALSFRARFSSGLVASAGLLGYRYLTSVNYWDGGGSMPDWIAEAQVGVGWQLQ